jgi:holo-[acyl-carrier protein] synthase
VVAVRGGVKEVVEQLGITKLLVSISHCRTHATAYAIAWGGKDEGEK